MIRVIQRRLIIPRGDTGIFTIPAMTQEEGAIGVFTIFDPITNTRIFQKQVEIEGENFNISFSHADTVNLKAGEYLWDIKFYKNPILADNKVIDGEEINSYYAAFQAPKCEIRETGDDFLMIEGQPAKIEDLNVILAATEAANAAKVAATEKAEEAAAKLAEMVAAIPTKVSELENDSGYLQQETDPTVPAWAKTQTKPSYTPQEVGALPADTFIPSKVSDLTDDSGHYTKPVTGIPASDLEETYLTAHQDISMKANSADLAAVATSGSYNDLENKPFIPSKVSDLTDDSGHYTKPAGGIPASDLAEEYLTAHQDISGKADKSEIPTKVSQLQNDSGYLTSFTETDPTVPAWAKAAQKPSYTAAEVGAPTVQEMNTAIGTAIGNVNSFDMAVVQALPEQDISTHTIYLVPKTGETNDVYDEYVYINDAWEMVGNTQVDLSNYALKSEIPEVPVQDVQINGTSIENNGIVNIPLASDNAFGLARGYGEGGLRASNGLFFINPATSENIKEGQQSNKPIVPYFQHQSAFYGLAKAAGDTTQSQSDNAVGTYTNEAKAAIRSMIGAAASADLTVQDVQVNGSSILNNGIANIPPASDNVYGVVQVRTDGKAGIKITSNVLSTAPAGPGGIKYGTMAYMPIVPYTQHESVFYGLAKAAGADMKDIANTTVGTYPDAQKEAIQSMLGITQMLAPTNPNLVASQAYSIGDVFAANGHLYKATAAIAQDAAIIPDTNCVETTMVDAGGKIKDVQVAGTSVVNNGVANIPVAGSNTLGVTRGYNNSGINIDSSGNVSLAVADETKIKAAISTGSAISPGRQHISAFYGLSKIAGVDLANEEVTLGTYPETSKTAIRSLIGAAAASDIPSVPVQDVQVNGTSVLSSGVANVPVATNTTLGVVKGNQTYGVTIWGGNTAGQLAIVPASDSQIKSGNQQYAPITATTQHQSVFYGLAKASGDTTQSQSSNAVGTYTESAKASIRTMLGAASPDVIAVQDTQPTNTDTKVWLPETQAAGVQVPTMEDLGDYVQKTDYATAENFGVTKIGMGLKVNQTTHMISTDGANVQAIKVATNNYQPITPYYNKEAVFYGLAKAAGDSTQSASDNAVGTYTADASAAIRSMLGITQTLTVTVLTQDNVTVTGQTVTVREGGPTGQVYATATYSGQPVSFALPTGFSYYVSVSDTLDHHFNPTTASGIITDADAVATLTYSDFSSIQTAADIKAALNAGLDLTDLVGEQISCTWNNSTLVWDVVDYSNDTITLLTHDTLPTQLVFEPVQALAWFENGLAAGNYSFIDGTTTYYFTLTTAIPSGGQLRATTSAFQTYASTEATATLETGTVSTTEISGATSLGTTASGDLNHMSRVNYGSNNYKESGLFQWLNSTEAANTPMPRITKFSRPCTYNVPGFLGALDSSFVAAIDDTTWLCSTNNTYECPTSLGGTVAKSNAYTVTAKVGLASEMEIFGSYGGTVDGSTVFDLFNGATADDRKKYQPGTSTARYWWLRSPYWSSASSERHVYSSGTANNNSAYSSGGVVPAVKISKTVMSE